MGQPYPGGYPQQPGGHGQFGQPGQYGHPGGHGQFGQPGVPAQYGQPPAGPGYGQPHGGFAPRGPSTAMAYVTAILYLPAIAILYLSAGVSTDPPQNEFGAHMNVTLTGLAFVDPSTDIVDAMIAVTFSYPSVLLLFVLLLFARLGFARWIAAGLGFLGFAYYAFALVKFLAIGYEVSSGSATYEVTLDIESAIFPAIVGLVLLVASILAVLPATGRAMRGYRPKPPVGPPGYGARF